MLDMIMVVKEPLQWHRDNLKRNGHHYSFLRRCSPDLIEKLQEVRAGVYYNTLVPVDGQVSREGGSDRGRGGGAMAEDLVAHYLGCHLIPA